MEGWKGKGFGEGNEEGGKGLGRGAGGKKRKGREGNRCIR